MTSFTDDGGCHLVICEPKSLIYLLIEIIGGLAVVSDLLPAFVRHQAFAPPVDLISLDCTAVLFLYPQP